MHYKIYGLYVVDTLTNHSQLVYIGQTARTLDDRLATHKLEKRYKGKCLEIRLFECTYRNYAKTLVRKYEKDLLLS